MLFCHEEIRLNQRFVPDRYIAVLPITGSISQPVIGGDGEAIEYAVKMRQFDQDCLMENIAEQDHLSDDHAQMIGVMMAGMHEKLEQSIYTPQVTQRLFQYLLKLTKQIISAGFSVIVDATFLGKKWRDEFYWLSQDCHVSFYIIDCVVNFKTIENWLELRSSDITEASEANFSIAKQQKKTM